MLCGHLGANELSASEVRSFIQAKVVLSHHLVASLGNCKPFSRGINYSEPSIFAIEYVNIILVPPARMVAPNIYGILN